jgi:hypothetical protein
MFPLLSFVMLLFSSCSSSCSPPIRHQKPVEPTCVVQPIIAPRTPLKIIDIWLDDTASYPRRYFNEAKNALANAIDQAVQANTGGVVVYVNLISSNSFKPESTVLTIAVPMIDADPSLPTQKAKPAPTGDPFHDAQVAQKINAENAQAKQCYQQALITHHALLARTQQQVRTKTDMLRALNPPVDYGTRDLWGVIGRAGVRLNGGKTLRFLIVVTSLDMTNWNEFYPGETMWGTHVKVLWWYCHDVAACNTAFWKGAFLHAGAASVTLLDPAQSSTLTNPFS